jgi:hypothetical protein
MTSRPAGGLASWWGARLVAWAALLGVAGAAQAAPPEPAVRLSVRPRVVRAGELVTVTAEVRGQALAGPADGYIGVNDSHGRFLILGPTGQALGREALPAFEVAPGEHLVREFRVRLPPATAPSWYRWGLLVVRAGADPMAGAAQLGAATAYGRVDEPAAGRVPPAAGRTLALATGLVGLLAVAMRFRRQQASVALGYAALTTLLTYPLAGHLADAVPGFFDSDTYVFLWNLWWMRRAALEEWTSPFFTRAIYAPEGVGLAFHALTPLNGLLALPLAAVGGIPFASNLIQLGGFVLSAWGTFLLLRALGCCRPAAFVGGIVFAFSPFRVHRFLEGHFNLTSTHWLPLALACELRALGGGPAWRREAALAGACLAAAAWTDLVILFLALLLAAVVAAVPAVGGRRRRAALGVMAGVFLLGAAPLVGPVVRAVLAGSAVVPGAAESGAALFKTDLLGFVVPSVFHPLLGGWSLRLAERFGWSLENTAYLGLMPLLLAAAGLAGRWRDRAVRCWAGVALASLIFSLGPFPTVAGTPYPAIALPFRLLAAVPVLNNFRSPNRFVVCLTLAVAILAGLGLARWLRGEGGAGWGKRLALGGVTGLIVFEFLAIPMPLLSGTVPEVYARIARERGEGVVLEVPLGRAAAFASVGTFFQAQMYWQTAHGRPIIGGLVSRAAASRVLALREEPILASLLDLQAGLDLSPSRLREDRERAPELIARLNLRWVLVHPPFYRGRVERYLRAVLPLEPLADQDGIAAYRVVRAPTGIAAEARPGTDPRPGRPEEAWRSDRSSATLRGEADESKPARDRPGPGAGRAGQLLAIPMPVSP